LQAHPLGKSRLPAPTITGMKNRRPEPRYTHMLPQMDRLIARIVF